MGLCVLVRSGYIYGAIESKMWLMHFLGCKNMYLDKYMIWSTCSVTFQYKVPPLIGNWCEWAYLWPGLLVPHSDRLNHLLIAMKWSIIISSIGGSRWMVSIFEWSSNICNWFQETLSHPWNLLWHSSILQIVTKNTRSLAAYTHENNSSKVF